MEIRHLSDKESGSPECEERMLKKEREEKKRLYFFENIQEQQMYGDVWPARNRAAGGECGQEKCISSLRDCLVRLFSMASGNPALPS